MSTLPRLLGRNHCLQAIHVSESHFSHQTIDETIYFQGKINGMEANLWYILTAMFWEQKLIIMNNTAVNNSSSIAESYLNSQVIITGWCELVEL